MPIVESRVKVTDKSNAEFKTALNILLVEDDKELAGFVQQGLEDESCIVKVCHDGGSGLRQAELHSFDIILLDVMMPVLNGFEVTKRLRLQNIRTPILLLTARDAPEDIVKGLDAGADDYLTKPFELRELVLRLRALDRRRAHNRPPMREIAGLRLDPFRREVYRNGHYVALTRKQFAVLEVLVAAEGGVVSAEDLLERAWDENADPATNAVRIVVSALRKRLGEPWIVATVAGIGYRISTQPETGREGGDRG